MITLQALRKWINYGMLGVFIGIILLQPTLQAPSAGLNTNKSEVTSNIDIHSPFSQGSEYLTNLPFFDNSSPLVDWLSQMVDEATTPASPSEPYFPMYFAESNQVGDIIDYNHYLEDFAVFLDGFVNIAYPDLPNYDLLDADILDYYDRLKDLDFWDNNETDTMERGYYSSINSDWTVNSTIKELNGNAQILITFIDWILNNEPGADSLETTIIEQWNVINNLFWDVDLSMYNHSTDFIGEDKYMEDQFIAAIAGFLISKSDISSISTDALTKAGAVMEEMVKIGIYEYNSFKTQQGEDLKSLTANAYGIWALTESHMTNANETYDAIQLAESTFQKVNETLWDSSYGLFMSEMDLPATTVTNNLLTLKGNAIMMQALENLFTITGNFTYFQTCMSIFDNIQTSLRDPFYGNYFNSINSTNGAPDTNKNLNAHAYYIRSVSSLESLAQYSSAQMTLNASEFVLEDGGILNISSSFYLLKNGVFNASVEDATFFTVIRAPNGTIIFQESNSGDENGTADLLFPVESNWDAGLYSISLRVNYTGLETQYASRTFSINSGLVLTEHSLSKTEVFAGESTQFTFSVNNTLENNMTLSARFNGTDIINQTILDIDLINGTLNNFTYTIQSNVGALIGDSIITFELFNESVVFESYNHTISILNPIKIHTVKQKGTLYSGGMLTIAITLENLVDVSHTIEISLTGDSITPSIDTYSLNAGETKEIVLVTEIDSHLTSEQLLYSLQIIRSTDEDEIYSQEFQGEIKTPVSLMGITVPETTFQGDEITILCRIQNNLDIAQNATITLTFDGTEYSTTHIIVPGENLIRVFLPKISSPYNYGMKYFLLELYDTNGELFYQESLSTNLRISFAGGLFGYFLPVMVPIVGILIAKHASMENKKRLG
jgi:hypothetical protein